MNTIRAIQKLNKRELEEGISTEGSWHTDYRDTAFVYIGGLPFELSEGDIITIFSQYGEPVWIKLARDKETGKSRGFCWIKYEDQRSTDLAVDNLGGATIMGRLLRVDHTRYKPRDDEDMRDNTMGETLEDPEKDNDGRRKRRRTESESESEDERPLLREEIELEKLIRDLEEDDPMKASMVKRKQEEVDAAVKKYEKARRKEKRDKKHLSRKHRRDDSRDRDRDRRRIKDRKDRSDDEHRESKSRRRDHSREREHRRERDRDSDYRTSKPRRRNHSESDHERSKPRGKEDDDRLEHSRRKPREDSRDRGARRDRERRRGSYSSDEADNRDRNNRRSHSPRARSPRGNQGSRRSSD
ncbi:RNA-binding motif protein [Dendryphion nanum]|uniref:RNA-binding motif protein n=1 Tax=Dendryphion nanum TaxID=256645 RepID=A0A9P9D505_9PLEO|nr:RNA-binding motif protein [Dendryphion nanum]